MARRKEVADHFGINNESAKTFYKNRAKIREHPDNRKKVRAAEFPLINFIRLARLMRITVTGAVIRAKAEVLRAKHGVPEDKFCASKEWMYKFLRRKGINKSVCLHGKAGIVNSEALQQEMKDLCKKLHKYPTRCIYNQYETGYLYQLFPKVTYLAPEEDAKSARGTKGMRSRNRITLAVSANVTGPHIIPPYFIGKAKRPAYWGLASSNENRKLKVTFASQRNAWMDELIFNQYLHYWHYEVRKVTSDNVCLIVDNCSAHGDALPSFPGVEYIFLPPNVTAVFQPLDMGVLISIKNVAREKLLQKIIQNIEHYTELRALGKKQPNGMREVDYCFPANVLDAIRVICYACEKLYPQTVSNCWVKAGILIYKHVSEIFLLRNRKFSEKYEKTPGGMASITEQSLVNNVSLSDVTDCEGENENVSSFMGVVDALCSSSDGMNQNEIQKTIEELQNEVADLESARIEVSVSNPTEIIAVVDEVAEEIRKEYERLQVIAEQEEQTRISEVEKEMERMSFTKLSENSKWLKDIVKKGESRNLNEEVFAKQVDALRVNREN